MRHTRRGQHTRHVPERRRRCCPARARARVTRPCVAPRCSRARERVARPLSASHQARTRYIRAMNGVAVTNIHGACPRGHHTAARSTDIRVTCSHAGPRCSRTCKHTCSVSAREPHCSYTYKHKCYTPVGPPHPSHTRATRVSHAHGATASLPHACQTPARGSRPRGGALGGTRGAEAAPGRGVFAPRVWGAGLARWR